jgi:hypothetical protein
VNDTDPFVTVREGFTVVHMSTPTDAIIARGRSLRRRSRIPAFVAGAIALGMGLGLGISALRGNSAPVDTTLTAWTVSREQSGTVLLTVEQLRDPVGLQRILRTDGIPVNVGFYTEAQLNPPLPASCRKAPMSDQANTQLQDRILVPATSPQIRSISLGVRPGAIPHGIGLYLAVHSGSQGWGWGVDLVQASPACTG